MFRLVLLPYLNLYRFKTFQILNLELGIIGGLITPVHSLLLTSSLPIYQVKLDKLPLP